MGLKPLTELPFPESIDTFWRDKFGEGRLDSLKVAISKAVKKKWEDAAKASRGTQTESQVQCTESQDSGATESPTESPASGAFAALPRILPAALLAVGFLPQ